MTSLLCPDNLLLLLKALTSNFISSRFKLRDWPADFQVSNSSSTWVYRNFWDLFVIWWRCMCVDFM